MEAKECNCDDARGCPACFALADQTIGKRIEDSEGRVFRVTRTDEKNGYPTVQGDEHWAQLHDVELVPAPSPLDVLEAARSGNTDADALSEMADDVLAAYPTRRPLAGAGPSNTDRARWAGASAELFAAFTGQSAERDGRWEIVGDLVCNLMHWLDADPEAELKPGDSGHEGLLDHALKHYRAEAEATELV